MNLTQLTEQIEKVFPDQPPLVDQLVDTLWGIDRNGKPQEYVHPEAVGVQAFFAGRPWHDFVGAPLIEMGGWAFSALSVLGVRGRIFYLPAFMLTAMSDIHTNPDLVGGLFNCLTPPKLIWLNDEEQKQMLSWIESDNKLPAELKEGLRETFSRNLRWDRSQQDASLKIIEQKYNDFIASMTDPQKRAVRSFIAFMQDTYGVAIAHEAERALKGYWEKVTP